MKFHQTLEGHWQLISEEGEIQAQIRDQFLQHEMNRTGVSEENTLRQLFAYAIKLQDTLDALNADDQKNPWWQW